MDRIFTHLTNINQISTTSGSDRTGPINCSADRMFPNSPDVQPIAYLQGYYCTPTYLMKNDLNGHFLTDQPGQPFIREIREHAGIGVLMNADHLKPRLTDERLFRLDFYSANEKH